MKEIEEGEYFELNTPNRIEAMKLVLKKLKKGPKDKGILVKALEEEEVYDQRKDCKDFIKNLIKAENHQIVESSRREIALPRGNEVTAK